MENTNLSPQNPEAQIRFTDGAPYDNTKQTNHGNIDIQQEKPYGIMATLLAMFFFIGSITYSSKMVDMMSQKEFFILDFLIYSATAVSCIITFALVIKKKKLAIHTAYIALGFFLMPSILDFILFMQHRIIDGENPLNYNAPLLLVTVINLLVIIPVLLLIRSKQVKATLVK